MLDGRQRLDELHLDPPVGLVVEPVSQGAHGDIGGDVAQHAGGGDAHIWQGVGQVFVHLPQATSASDPAEVVDPRGPHVDGGAFR